MGFYEYIFIFKDNMNVSSGEDISSSYLLFATRVLALQHCFQIKQTRLNELFLHFLSGMNYFLKIPEHSYFCIIFTLC